MRQERRMCGPVGQAGGPGGGAGERVQEAGAWGSGRGCECAGVVRGFAFCSHTAGGFGRRCVELICLSGTPDLAGARPAWKLSVSQRGPMHANNTRPRLLGLVPRPRPPAPGPRRRPSGGWSVRVGGGGGGCSYVNRPGRKALGDGLHSLAARMFGHHRNIRSYGRQASVVHHMGRGVGAVAPVAAAAAAADAAAGCAVARRRHGRSHRSGWTLRSSRAGRTVRVSTGVAPSPCAGGRRLAPGQPCDPRVTQRKPPHLGG
jgi:hypothetical protein